MVLRGRLTGGDNTWSVVGVDVLRGDERGLTTGVVAGVVGLGVEGSGKLISLNACSQNGLIFSYRYHCLWDDSPGGGMIVGRSVEETGVVLLFNWIEMPSLSEYSLQITIPRCKQ